MFELLWLLFTTVLAWARPRQDLVLENLLVRHQLAVLTRPTRTRPRARLRLWDKVRWILARRWCVGWREHLTFVTPDTVVRWHRQGWRLFWRWKSRPRGGRPHLSAEVMGRCRPALSPLRMVAQVGRGPSFGSLTSPLCLASTAAWSRAPAATHCPSFQAALLSAWFRPPAGGFARSAITF